MLLFPVKLGPVMLFVLGAAANGCGYRSALGPTGGGERWSVAAAPFTTADVAAVAAVLRGAREALARADALGDAAFPRLVVEVARVDEVPAAIQARGGAPLGQGSTLGVTARGWVEEQPEGPHLHDTGDVRRVETVEQGADAVRGALSASEAIQAAARQTGQALARRALGLPEPAIEPI
jgi:hypothetical protein